MKASVAFGGDDNGWDPFGKFVSAAPSVNNKKTVHLVEIRIVIQLLVERSGAEIVYGDQDHIAPLRKHLRQLINDGTVNGVIEFLAKKCENPFIVFWGVKSLKTVMLLGQGKNSVSSFLTDLGAVMKGLRYRGEGIAGQLCEFCEIQGETSKQYVL